MHCSGFRLIGLFLVLGFLSISRPALAAGKDCPFVGALEDFPAARDVYWYSYISQDFETVEGNSKKTVSKIGKLCYQQYNLKPGLPKASGLEIMSNFEQALPAAGVQITNTKRASDDDIYATLTKDGAEYWFHIWEGNGDVIGVKVVEVAPFQNTMMAPSGNDYPLLGHLPHAVAAAPIKTNYDEVAFQVQTGNSAQNVKVRGYHYKVNYEMSNYRQGPYTSGLEAQQNYRAALKALGADILFAPGGDDVHTVARLDDKGKTVWIDIDGNGAAGVLGTITVNVIEEKPLQLTIKPPQADEMKTALDRDGKITLYVNFDFNKATLKPDAQPVLAQVVALLKANPDLKLSVEGHTDSIGQHDYNLQLSKDRAASVVAALVAQSIDAGRLSSTGYGPDKPIAPNESDAGRAKNRRVELIKG
jgi:outer membrane protein OmpA-like peptidoglycan-associated protein